MKKTLAFTQARMDRLPYGSARAVIYDVSPDSPRGFVLRVSARSKVYYVLATIRGKGRTWVRLGDAVSVKLKDARNAAWTATGEIARGKDLNAEARRQREAEAEKARPEWTVEQMVRAYMDARPMMSESTILSRTWVLSSRIAPNFKMLARDVVRDDVRRGIRRIAETSKANATVALRLLRTAFRWAMDEEVIVMVDGRKVVRPRIDRDPTRRVEDEIGLPRYRPRKRHLDDAEIQVFWKSVEGLGPRETMFLRLVLLCGTRSTETHLARWEDVQLTADATWHIPARNRKGKPAGMPGERRHLDVPLAPLAVRLLETFRPLSGNKERVFFAIYPPELGADATRVSSLPRFTVHDLRRSCASGLQRIGAPPHVISVVLGHAREEGATATDAAYTHDRRGSEHRMWLNRWAEHVEGLLSRSNQ